MAWPKIQIIATLSPPPPPPSFRRVHATRELCNSEEKKRSDCDFASLSRRRRQWNGNRRRKRVNNDIVNTRKIQISHKTILRTGIQSTIASRKIISRTSKKKKIYCTNVSTSALDIDSRAVMFGPPLTDSR